MRPIPILPRILAALPSLSLALPNSAYALRTENSQQSPKVKAGLEEALQSSDPVKLAGAALMPAPSPSIPTPTPAVNAQKLPLAAAGAEEGEGLSADEPEQTGESVSGYLGRQLELNEVLKVPSNFKPDLVEIALEVAPGRGPNAGTDLMMSGVIMMPDVRGQWGERDATHFRNKLNRMLQERAARGSEHFDVVIRNQSRNRYGSPLEGYPAPYRIASVGVFLPESGRPAAGAEEGREWISLSDAKIRIWSLMEKAHQQGIRELLGNVLIPSAPATVSKEPDPQFGTVTVTFQGLHKFGPSGLKAYSTDETGRGALIKQLSELEKPLEFPDIQLNIGGEKELTVTPPTLEARVTYKADANPPEIFILLRVAPAAGAEEDRQEIQRALDTTLSMQPFQVQVEGEAGREAGIWVQYRGIGGFVPNRLLLHPSGVPLKAEERRDWLNKHVGKGAPAYPVEISDRSYRQTTRPLFFGLLISEEPSAETLQIQTLQDVVTLPGAFHILMEAAKGGTRPAEFLSELWNRGFDPRPMVVQWHSDLEGWESLMQHHRKVIVSWMVEHPASSGGLDLFGFFRNVALPDKESRWFDYMETRIQAARGMKRLLAAEKDGNRLRQMQEDYAQVAYRLVQQSGQSWVKEPERRQLGGLLRRRRRPPAAGAEEMTLWEGPFAQLESTLRQWIPSWQGKGLAVQVVYNPLLRLEAPGEASHGVEINASVTPLAPEGAISQDPKTLAQHIAMKVNNNIESVASPGTKYQIVEVYRSDSTQKPHVVSRPLPSRIWKIEIRAISPAAGAEEKYENLKLLAEAVFDLYADAAKHGQDLSAVFKNYQVRLQTLGMSPDKLFCILFNGDGDLEKLTSLYRQNEVAHWNLAFLVPMIVFVYAHLKRDPTATVDAIVFDYALQLRNTKVSSVNRTFITLDTELDEKQWDTTFALLRRVLRSLDIPTAGLEEGRNPSLATSKQRPATVLAPAAGAEEESPWQKAGRLLNTAADTNPEDVGWVEYLWRVERTLLALENMSAYSGDNLKSLIDAVSGIFLQKQRKDPLSAGKYNRIRRIYANHKPVQAKAVQRKEEGKQLEDLKAAMIQLRNAWNRSASPAAGAEEVKFYDGFTEQRTGNLATGLEELVQKRKIRPGEHRAVVTLPVATDLGITRIFIHSDLPGKGLGIPLPRDPAQAAQFLRDAGVSDTDLILLPLTVAPGSEISYRPAASKTPIVVIPASVLEEANSQVLAALAFIAKNLKDQVLRVDLEEWTQRVWDRDRNNLSIQY